MEEKEKIDYKKIIEELKPHLEKEYLAFKEELLKLRASRASPTLIENILVDLYGKNYPLKQLGAITVLNPREIVIQPWDPSYFPAIQKAIENSGLGVSLSVTQNQIKIQLPPMTEEFRKELLKLVSQKKETVRKKMRELREAVLRKLQNAFLEKKLSEDEKYKAKKDLQKLIDEYTEQIEELVEKKRKEIEQ
ncbi:ribosome recycling factor [Candidatus Parcubacteria bacterium]|nr:ribosome recycling factor [Candidatus Parcubacteria bacterium]